MIVAPGFAAPQQDAALPDVAVAADPLSAGLPGFGAELAALLDAAPAEAEAQTAAETQDAAPDEGEDEGEAIVAPPAPLAVLLPWSAPAMPPAPAAPLARPAPAPMAVDVAANPSPPDAAPMRQDALPLAAPALPAVEPADARPVPAGADAAPAQPTAPAVAAPAAPASAPAPARVETAQWAPLPLPAAEPARWGQQLRAALGERLALQSAHGMDRALIRLDPPQLGELTIDIRHQGGALSVQLTASHGEVARQLQGVGEAIRQDLSARQYAQVDVEVKSGGQGGTSAHDEGRRGRGHETPRAPGRALADDGEAPSFTLQV